MSKLYIFAIGGTGSRVLKSLTMLLASGVTIDADIVPVIVDADAGLGDLTRTVEMMKYYSSIRSNLSFPSQSKNTFFKTNIDLSPTASFNACLPINNTTNVKFKDFIGLSTMKNNQGKEDANYAMSRMLFSDANLNSDMDQGFSGNPNIGCVVLNQFQSSLDFQNIISTFQQGDRIFIISSIFGGTGASGFPLLIKNLRNLNPAIGCAGIVKNCPIGALSVLPYFSVKNSTDDTPDKIDGTTFLSKTKAALKYYDRNLNEANVVYYIGDNVVEQYDNFHGGSEQKNDAHLVELASALSIVDFMRMPSGQFLSQNGVPQNPLFKEFGLSDDNGGNVISFKNLSETTNSVIKKPMVQYAFFAKYLSEHIENAKSQPWMVDKGFDDNYIHSSFFTTLQIFNQHLFDWYSEMARNKRSFEPFDFSKDTDKLFNRVVGIEPAKMKFTLNSNYSLFDAVLNKTAKQIEDSFKKDDLFVELFYRATTQLLKDKLRIS